MMRETTQNSDSPRGGVKRHPVGADWRCSCHGHDRKKDKSGAKP